MTYVFLFKSLSILVSFRPAWERRGYFVAPQSAVTTLHLWPMYSRPIGSIKILHDFHQQKPDIHG